MYTIGSIIQAVPTQKMSINYPDAEIQRLEYDSRRLAKGEESLFFALHGARDGHLFIRDAYKQGVRNFVLSDLEFDVSDFQGCNFIWVHDTLRALQSLAASHRQQCATKVIAITGSNGKTIVKEWLHQMLSVDYACYQSPKSYNSQLGVALALWEIRNDHQIALIEAGISQVGEMQHLETMIKPDIGVFTALGTAHSEGFSSKEQKLAEKWKLFQGVTQVIAPSLVAEIAPHSATVFRWGQAAKDDLQVVSTTSEHYHTKLHLMYGGIIKEFHIPFVDRASIDNVLTCVATMLTLGYTLDVIQQRVYTLQPLEMRLQLKRGKNNCSILDDSYSNDLASLRIALDFLRQQNQHSQKSLIITDFVGAAWNEKLSNQVLQLIQSVDFYRIVLVGSTVTQLAKFLTGKVYIFKETPSLIAALPEMNFHEETLLIKGARKFQLEEVVALLVQKTHSTSLEINLKAIEHNLSQYRSKLQPEVKLMAMVKAFSYGSGSFEVANILQFHNVDYLTVAFADEGVELRQGGIQLPIMVLSPDEGTFEDMVRHSLEPEIYSFRILRQFTHFLQSKSIHHYPIHIKLDTGMHRLGFLPEEIPALLNILKRTGELEVKSVFSHFVAAGNADYDEFTQQQARIFREVATKFEQELGYSLIKHICNSSAIVHRPQDHLDMVRLGIGLYGIEMNSKGLDLQEVGLLKTSITQIKSLRSGDTVGYDRKGVLTKDSRIATVKIGYADGYDRRFGNGVGQMKVNGQLVPTIGNICMDMCMLDVGDLDVREGDEVLVFPDIRTAAKRIGTIPYELLTGMSSRVKRIYYYE